VSETGDSQYGDGIKWSKTLHTLISVVTEEFKHECYLFVGFVRIAFSESTLTQYGEKERKYICQRENVKWSLLSGKSKTI